MGRRAQGEGSVYRRKDGYWCASVRLPSGKRVTRYTKNRKDAAAALAQLARRRSAGQLAPNSRVTVAEWMTQWLRLRAPSLRSTTLRNYETAARRHIVPALGPVRLARLTPLQVEMMVAALAERHPYMARTVHHVLRMACEHAVTSGILGHNPLRAVRPPKAMPKSRARWTARQFALFLCDTRDHREGALWAVLGGGGLRLGEALGLEWEDIELAEGDVRVRRSLAWSGSRAVLSAPKTAAGERRVALPVFAVERLKLWRGLQLVEREDAGETWRNSRDAVFTEPGGRSPSQGQVWRRFQRACDRAEVPRMRVHDLRHVHASIAVSVGVDPKTLQARLGHASLEMTLGVYAHADPSLDRQAAGAFDRLLRDHPASAAMSVEAT